MFSQYFTIWTEIGTIKGSPPIIQHKQLHLWILSVPQEFVYEISLVHLLILTFLFLNISKVVILPNMYAQISLQ